MNPKEASEVGQRGHQGITRIQKRKNRLWRGKKGTLKSRFSFPLLHKDSMKHFLYSVLKHKDLFNFLSMYVWLTL